MEKFDVIVVGLGPSGSLASLLLNSYGLKVLAIDKAKDIYPLPRAVTISDQGLRIAQLVGIEDIYLDNSTELGGACFVDGNLDLIGGTIDLKGYTSSNGWPASRLFHQPYTDQAIREKLQKSNVKVLLGHELSEIENKNNNVHISVEDLNINKKFKYSSKYLLGSDGSNSLVRKLLNISQKDLSYNRNWVVVDIKLNGENKLGDKVIQICDKKRLATFVPSHLPFRRWEFLVHDNEKKDDFLDNKKIKKLISKWLKADEYEIIRKAVYQFHSVIAEKFQNGNCFLIGDAAHQSPPFMGEGMMSGYRDVVNLCWKIALTIKLNLKEELLKTYEKERIPHSRFVVENSAGIGELMEAYAEAEDPNKVPKELIKKGYGSFILPDLKEGLFFGGVADEEMKSGTLFPQPIQYSNKKIDVRLDRLLGKGFCLISSGEHISNKENMEFLKNIDCKFLVLKKEIISKNPFLKSLMKNDKVFLVRPDRYIFGSTTSDVSLDCLVGNLKQALAI